MKSKCVYLDNTATTRTRREVVSEMMKYFKTIYANPSSIHRSGLIARGSIEMARERIARVLGCASEEIVFTGSGSESNNLAIKGTARILSEKGKHIITSQIEHNSVLNTCQDLEKEGCRVTYLPVDREGRIDLEQLAGAISEDTILVSLGYVNNEVGTVQDIEKIISLVRGRGILFHTDAVQALPYFEINLSHLGADMVSFSGHKLYAPKGVGMLYIHRGISLHPLIFGGNQEFGLRSGTENVPYIVGLSKAVNLNFKEKKDYVRKLSSLRDCLIKGVLEGIPDCILSGHLTERSPNHASFVFKGINGKMLVKQLAQYGIEVSSGSACSSPGNDPSHVIAACGMPVDYLFGSIRVTLGRYNTQRDVDYFLEVLPRVVGRMRREGVSYDNESIFISQEDFRKRLEEDAPLQILDVRHIKYPRQQIPGSIFTPAWRLKSQLKRLDHKVETVVVCYQGDILSPEVQQMLVREGFNRVRVLKGGLFSYVGHTV